MCIISPICKIWSALHILHILHIDHIQHIILLVLIRIEHCSTPCVFRSPTPTRDTSSFTPPFWLGILNTLVTCASPRFRLWRRHCGGPIARTWCLYARPGYPRALLSSGWVTFGSASCFSCSKYVQEQTLGWRTSIVPMSLCWRSTTVQEDQVI